MKSQNVVFQTIITIAIVSGCSVINAGTATSVESVEGKKMSDGSWYLYDTPSQWAEFQRMMNMHIQREVSGAPPFHGHDTTWVEFWAMATRAFTADRQENYQKYITYIVEARRRAGLPELHDRL